MRLNRRDPEEQDRTGTLWVDLVDAMRFSGLGRYVIYRLSNEGRIKTMKVGQRTLFSRRSIENLENTVPPPEKKFKI